MLQLSKKAVPALFLVLALVLGAWTFQSAPGGSAFAKKTPTPTQPSVGTPILQGSLGQIPLVQQKINQISSFEPKMSAITKGNTSKDDKQFIEDSLKTNTEELAMIQYSLTRATNSDWRDLLNMMNAMHSKDQQTLLQLQLKVNGNQSADPSNVSVNPKVPEYTLGVRTDDLNSKYMDRLQSYSGSNFDLVSLDLLMEIHGEDVQDEIASQFQVSNPQIKMMTVNAAAETQLHIDLMDALHDQQFVGIQPDVSYQPYQGSGGQSPTPSK